MQVEIDLDNKDGKLKPGLYAKVQMELNSRKEVLSVPVTAQVMFQNEACLLLVNDGIVERVPARKGLTNKDFFEVMNPAVTDKSQVIVQGKGLVKPGDRVEAVVK
jgi:multidrug efflux pump subunit AcrA (membrane-fusion protein)